MITVYPYFTTAKYEAGGIRINAWTPVGEFETYSVSLLLKFRKQNFFSLLAARVLSIVMRVIPSSSIEIVDVK